MSERRTHTKEAEMVDIEDLNGMTKDAFAAWAAKVVAEWPDPAAKIDSDERWEGGYDYIKWKWQHTETDDEVAVRKETERKAEERAAFARRQQYEALKKEFGE